MPIIFFLILLVLGCQNECSPTNKPTYGGSFQSLISSSSDFSNASFFLTELSFESDVPFSKNEFLYLSELKEGTIVTNQQVVHAYNMLSHKKTFHSINIDISDSGTGKHLHFKLSGAWIFKKLIFNGITFGKFQYTSLYSQQPGSIFDASIHDESVKEIKNFLQNQGYFNSKVNDEIIYSKKDKTINVKITVNRGKHFVINHVDFEIKNDDDELADKSKNKNDLIKKALIEQFSGTIKQSSYTKKKISKTAKKIKAFLKEKGFYSTKTSVTRIINPKTAKLDVVFNIHLGQHKVLKFKNNTVFTEQQLREDVLGIDEPGWLYSPDIIMEQIQQEYFKKGYWHTDIKYQNIPDGQLFKITESNPTFIEHIEIKDTQTHDSEQSYLFWEALLKKKQYNQVLLDEGIEKLKNFYISNGFWDFKVINKKFIKNPETGHYTINISVDKGLQRYWGGLEIKDFSDLETSQFFQKFKNIKPAQNIPFNLNWIPEQQAYLFSYFQKQGYWYADIQPELIASPLYVSKNTKQPLCEKVLLKWNVKSGEKVRFGKVVQRGVTKVPFKRVMKELKFKEGDLWNRDKIDLTRKKLKRLDVFKTVNIQPYQSSKNKSEKPVILTLIDDDPIELRVRAGYYLTNKNFMFKRQTTPKVGTSLIFKNPTQSADKLSLDADWTKFEGKLNVEYQQPSAFNTTAMGKFKGYANKYEHPVQIKNSGSAYTAIQSGLLVGLSDEFRQNYFWGINFGNEWVKTTKVHGFLKFNKNLIGKTLPYVLVEPSLVIDKLDDKINTTSGSMSFVSLKCMIPENAGDVTARLQAEQSMFYPIYEKIVVAGRLRLGYIFRQKFENVMPIERFYLGGPNTVRGYEKDGLPPLGVTEKAKETTTTFDQITGQEINTTAGQVVNEYTTYGDKDFDKDENVTREYTIQGGSAMLNGNLELRIPIYKSFGSVLFQDIGILSQSGFAGFQGTWFPSSGFGLRYKTPIGAIRFDMGWKWKRRFDSDVPYQIHLTLGEVF